MEHNKELLNLILERRSCRKYLPQPLDRPTLAAIAEAGRYAPSAMNRQPWRFSASDGCVGILPRPSVLTRKYAPIDCGIAMLHLAVGAYSAGHEGVWRSVETGYTYR